MVDAVGGGWDVDPFGFGCRFEVFGGGVGDAHAAGGGWAGAFEFGVEIGGGEAGPEDGGVVSDLAYSGACGEAGGLGGEGDGCEEVAAVHAFLIVLERLWRNVGSAIFYSHL